MSTCTSGQAPWRGYYLGSPFGDWSGSTPQAVCDAYSDFYGIAHADVTQPAQTPVPSLGESYFCDPGEAGDGYYFDVQEVCQPGDGGATETPGNAIAVTAQGGYVTVTFATGTQTVIVEPPPLDEDRIADIGIAFGALALALVIVYMSRALLDLLRTDPHRD
ncbi:MAG: hypothetical protein KF686_13585 [Ramlibacter sp.]|nr:hypothetical protein [Ramlibacter sp.]